MWQHHERNAYNYELAIRVEPKFSGYPSYNVLTTSFRAHIAFRLNRLFPPDPAFRWSQTLMSAVTDLRDGKLQVETIVPRGYGVCPIFFRVDADDATLQDGFFRWVEEERTRLGIVKGRSRNAGRVVPPKWKNIEYFDRIAAGMPQSKVVRDRVSAAKAEGQKAAVLLLTQR